MNKLWTIVASIAGVAGLAMLWNSLLNQFGSWSVWQFGFVAQQTSFDCAKVTDVTKEDCKALYKFYEANPNSLLLKNKFTVWNTTLCDQSWLNIGCISNRIHFIYIRKDNITSIDNISSLTNLKVLNLPLNNIKSVNIVNTQTMLTSLSLDTNGITSFDDIDISNLTNLEALDLDNNQIDSIPASIDTLINLKELRMRNNKITSIHNNISNLKKLIVLELDVNHICWPISNIINPLIWTLDWFTIYENYIDRTNKEDPVFTQLVSKKDRRYATQHPENCATSTTGEKYSCSTLTWCYLDSNGIYADLKSCTDNCKIITQWTWWTWWTWCRDLKVGEGVTFVPNPNLLDDYNGWTIYTTVGSRFIDCSFISKDFRKALYSPNHIKIVNPFSEYTYSKGIIPFGSQTNSLFCSYEWEWSSFAICAYNVVIKTTKGETATGVDQKSLGL